MWLTAGNRAQHLQSDDLLALAHGEPHAERYGSRGATDWVDRLNSRSPARPRRRGDDNRRMDLILVLLPLSVMLVVWRRHEERQRILLLGSHLKKYRIEQRMEQLTDGYLRALGETDPERSAPIWHNLAGTEAALQTELQQLADALNDVWGERLRVSRWPVSVPMATRLFPQHSFDLRALVQLHAQGLAATLRNDEGLSTRDRAFRATAELLLFQHSCHWFCRSKTVASARVLTRHQTTYEQVLAAVSPATRAGYERVTGLKPN